MAQAEVSTSEIPRGGSQEAGKKRVSINNRKRKAIPAGKSVEKEIRKGIFPALSFKMGGGRSF